MSSTPPSKERGITRRGALTIGAVGAVALGGGFAWRSMRSSRELTRQEQGSTAEAGRDIASAAAAIAPAPVAALAFAGETRFEVHRDGTMRRDDAELELPAVIARSAEHQPLVGLGASATRVIALHPQHATVGLYDAEQGAWISAANLREHWGEDAAPTAALPREEGGAVVLEATRHRVSIIDDELRVRHRFADAGTDAHELNGPRGLVSVEGGYLIADANPERLLKLDERAQEHGIVALRGLRGAPRAMVRFDEDTIALLDDYGRRLVLINEAGRILEQLSVQSVLGENASARSVVYRDGRYHFVRA